MTVYVDDMFASPTGRFGRMRMSHMIADTEAELHAMADRIGVARRWYQGDHYDVALSKRRLAVAAGAVEITWRQCGCMVGVRKRTGILPSPDTAEAELKAVYARMAEAAGITVTATHMAPAASTEET